MVTLYKTSKVIVRPSNLLASITICFALFYNMLPIANVFPGIVRYPFIISIICLSFLYPLFLPDTRIVLNNLFVFVFVLIFVFVIYHGMWSLRKVGTYQQILLLYQFWMYFLLSRVILFCDNQFKKRVFSFFLFLASITIITTIVGNIVFHNSSRLLGGLATQEEKVLFLRHNIGGYSFLYGMSMLIPFLLYCTVKKRKNFFYIMLIVVIILTLVFVEYTTALLAALVAVFLFLLFRTKNKILLLFLLAVLIYLFINKKILETLFNYFCNLFINFGLETIADRLALMSKYFTQGGSLSGDSLARRVLYNKSIDVFLGSPLFGCFFHPLDIGEHSEILDMLAGTGLFGFSMFCIMIIIHLRFMFRHIKDHELRQCIIISLIELLFISYFNTLFVGTIMAVSFFLIPPLLTEQTREYTLMTEFMI